MEQRRNPTITEFDWFVIMKLIVAGSRSIIDYKTVEKCILEYVKIRNINNHTLEIVCGMAKGVDILGYEFAARYGCVVHEFHADWDQFGKAAGAIRNKKMGDFADELLAIWDQKSRGTKHMIEYMGLIKKPKTICKFSATNYDHRHVFGITDEWDKNLLGF